MASLQLRNGWFHLHFRYQKRQYSHALKTKDRREAEALRGTVDRLLIRIRNKEFPPPPTTANLAEYLLTGGKITESVTQSLAFLTIQELGLRYIQAYSNGAMEDVSLQSMKAHFRRFKEVLGEKFPVQELTTRALQNYLDSRKRKVDTKKPLSPATLKKEMETLRAAWNWAVRNEMLVGTFPGRGVTYPKTDEKPPFQTIDEIERKIARGGLTPEEIKQLWACLFLTKSDVAEFLAMAKSRAKQPFLLPMLTFAAHTGARRSELIRMRIDDPDLEAGTAIIREKKRMRGHRSTRRVPISNHLKCVIQAWLAQHPGGQHLFCHQPQGGELRPLRIADAAKSFRRLVRGTKWQPMRGWHVLRHSFISICAADGVDQRVLQGWVGHLSSATHRRYTHLIPSREREIIAGVFG